MAKLCLTRRFFLPTPKSEGGLFVIMKKRIVALVLCVFMLVPVFSSCAGETVESVMQVYLSHQVYDLDPLNAMTNDAQLKIVNLIFSGLYKLDENGNIQDDLAARTEVINKDDENEYIIRITLKNTYWSDGSAVSADDVVYTFKRVLRAQNSNDAMAMLMNVKNAAEVKAGEISVDALGVMAPETDVVEIAFDKFITDDMLNDFKLSLTSPALFPLRENYVQGKPDWAKKPSSMVCSGPFILRKASYEEGSEQFVLERNEYYCRNREKDAVDKYVTPYRIIVDCGTSAEEQLELYNSGKTVFINEIPLSKRAEYKNKVKLTDTLSTHTYYFNQNASVYNKGYNEEIVEYFNDIYALTSSSLYKKYDNARIAWAKWCQDNPEDVFTQLPTFPEAPAQITLPSYEADLTTSKTLVYYSEETIAEFKAAAEAYNAKVAAFNEEYKNMMFEESQKPPVIPAVPEPEKQVKLFANENVRKALSLVIDRNAIANEIVYAKPATGLLGEKMFYGSQAGKTFRSQGTVISTTENVAEANRLIAASGINPSDYSFSLRYRAVDEVHSAVAAKVAAAWRGLGFDVVVEPIGVIVNDDVDPTTKETVVDIRDDVFDEAVATGENYQVMAIDMVAMSPDPISVLATYAEKYTGNKTVNGAEKVDDPHKTGYNSKKYNDLIDQAFAAETDDERAALLLEAEKLLVAEDAAVMPILFNQTATLISDKLGNITQSYYGYYSFTKATLKDWADYRDKYFPEDAEAEVPDTMPSDDEDETTDQTA